MDGVAHERGLEVGLYMQGEEAIVYLNQLGVCIFRERVSLLAELADGGSINIETLRKAAERLKI